MKYGEKKKGIVKKVIILSLIAASAAVTAVIVYKQRNNIIALNYAVNYSNTTPESSNNIGDLTAQIYSLRSSFSGKVDSLVAQAKSDAASGQYTKRELISKYARSAIFT